MKNILFVIILISFFSCKKEHPDSGNCRISSGSLDDDIYAISVNYDKEGKIVAYTDSFNENFTLNYGNKEVLILRGSDTIRVYKLNEKGLVLERYNPNEMFDTIRYTYDGQGFISSRDLWPEIQEHKLVNGDLVEVLARDKASGNISAVLSYQYYPETDPLHGNAYFPFLGKVSTHLLKRYTETVGTWVFDADFTYTRNSKGFATQINILDVFSGQTFVKKQSWDCN